MEDSSIKVFIDEKTLQSKVKELGDLITTRLPGQDTGACCGIEGFFYFCSRYLQAHKSAGGF